MGLRDRMKDAAAKAQEVAAKAQDAAKAQQERRREQAALDAASHATATAGAAANAPAREPGVAAQSPPAQARPGGVLMELKVGRMVSGEWRPNRIRLYADRIEEENPGFLTRSKMQVIRYNQVAQVALKKGMVWSTLTIESTGGHTIQADKLRSDEAVRAKRLVDEGCANAGQNVKVVETAAPPERIDVPAEIERLGALRDQGLLTDDEFGAAKAELLKKL